MSSRPNLEPQTDIYLHKVKLSFSFPRLSIWHYQDQSNRAHSESHRIEKEATKMAAMAALQSSMTSLSLSSNSFLGQRLSPPTLYAVPVPYPISPLSIFSNFLCSFWFFFFFFFSNYCSLLVIYNGCFKIVAFFSNFLCNVVFNFMLVLRVAIMVVFSCFISLLIIL